MRLMKKKRFFYNWTCSKNSSSQGHGVGDKPPCGSPNLTSTNADLTRGGRILPRCENCGRKKSVTRKECDNAHAPARWRHWQIAKSRYDEAKEHWMVRKQLDEATSENSNFSYVSIGNEEIEPSPSDDEEKRISGVPLSTWSKAMDALGNFAVSFDIEEPQTSEENTQTKGEKF